MNVTEGEGERNTTIGKRRKTEENLEERMNCTGKCSYWKDESGTPKRSRVTDE
jgi:hypothetical protein